MTDCIYHWYMQSVMDKMYQRYTRDTWSEMRCVEMS